jgi:hypothetical protein
LYIAINAMISSAAFPNVRIEHTRPMRPGVLGKMLGRFPHQLGQRDLANARENETSSPAPHVTCRGPMK